MNDDFLRVNETLQVADSIAPCGLVCALCHLADRCGGCRSETNCCGMRFSAQGCYQYSCCQTKDLDGCWECAEGPCEQGMFSESHDIRLRAFVVFIRLYGKLRLAECLLNNARRGIYYGHGRHYDGLGSIEQVIERLEDNSVDRESR